MLDSHPAWVAVMTHPAAELKVAKRFAEGEPPIEYYLPMIGGRDRRYRKQTVAEKPMFPCYVFARINNKQVYQTRTTKGVLFIVSSQHSITPVPDADIEAVRRFEASQRKIFFHQMSQLVRGSNAKILYGEFAGMEGTLVKNCKDGNFCINIEVMNLSIVTRVRRDELRPHDDDDATSNETAIQW